MPLVFFRATLADAKLTDADFSHTNLALANLCHTTATGADFRGANLTHADLAFADLREANLRGANLTKANLTETDLCEANLARANFTGARLQRVNWMDTNLVRADFTDATLTAATVFSPDRQRKSTLFSVCRLSSTLFNKTRYGNFILTGYPFQITSSLPHDIIFLPLDGGGVAIQMGCQIDSMEGWQETEKQLTEDGKLSGPEVHPDVWVMYKHRDVIATQADGYKEWLEMGIHTP